MNPVPEMGLELSLVVLDHVDVIHCGAVSRFWKNVGESVVVWNVLCDRCWHDKEYVPQKVRQLREIDPRFAFREALTDSKRNWIKLDELLEFRWWHRMKRSAGEHYINNDPWWNDALRAQRSFRFRPDHTAYWIDPETEAEEEGNGDGWRGGTWRFVPRCCGRVDGVWGEGICDQSAADEGGGGGPKFGRFIRGKPRHGMRETPTKVVFRHPNWGFVFDSCWDVQTLWRMPAHGSDAWLGDDALLMTVENMQQEACRYNKCQQIDSDDSDPFEEPG